MSTTVDAIIVGSPAASHLVARALRGDLGWIDSEPCDAEAFVASAVEHGVDLLLWHHLQANDAVPGALKSRLATHLQAEVARAAVRERELARVIRGFAGRGVSALVFKGAALAYTSYPKPCLRPRLDTDILVPREAFDEAVAVLLEEGYERSPLVSTGDLVSHQVAFERSDEYGIAHVVDLHWRVLNPQMLARFVDVETLLEDASWIAVHDTRVRVPAPVWSLVLACAHRLAHHQQQERLVWLYDIHVVARAFGQAEWDRLLHVARERQVSAICADGLDAAARLLGTAVPERVLTALTEEGRGDPSRRYTESHVRRLDVLRDDLQRLSWSERVHLLKEHAFPPAAFMRSRYQVENRLLLPVLYAHRLVTGAFKWIRA
jgi:hypothetical protein